MTGNAPAEPRGDGLHALVELMDILRSPGGCPWDAEQTHESLLEYLLEESYETVDAVHSGDRAALREELGDVLLQVMFHSRIAEEHPTDAFNVDDVAWGIVDKLRRRHPHVFADAETPAAHEAQARWEELKAAEKQRASVTDGVPDAMPASLLAVKLLGRASRKPVTAAVPTAKSDEIANAAHSAIAAVSASTDNPHRVVGDLLLAIIAEATHAGVDTETALRSAVHDYRSRVRAAEGLAG